MGRLTHIALLQRDRYGPSRWEAVAPHEVVRSLWESSGVALGPLARVVAASAIERVMRRVAFGRAVMDDRSFPPRPPIAAKGYAAGNRKFAE
jgi:hypothetical protein